MRGYWLRIIAGALAIFLVGFAVISVVRSGKQRVRTVTQTADPISIPLAFIPFNLDSSRVGTIRRLTILRSEPKSITGFRIRVELSDPDALRLLAAGCVMSVDNPTQLTSRTSFSCLPADSTMTEFGRVELLAETGGTRVDFPLYLPLQVVAEFRETGVEAGVSANREINADSIARSVRQMGDSIRRETRALADSVRREVTARPPGPTP
ncbi:MAG TPA: hypothetical protein VMK53_04410 [Gemmatimonadales bacterium]|nr:hypothetical protein [Gemmatimonadales bacterium]